MNRLTLLLIGACILTSAVSVQAQTWGDLTATFVLDGTAPKPTPIVPNKDEAVCGKQPLIDESLIVNPANNGIKDVVVFIYVNPRDPKAKVKPPIHDDYKKTEKAEIRFDNEKCRFEPHVASLRTTQTLIAGNKDPVGHNTNITSLKNPPSNILIPAGGNLKVNMTMDELLPVTVSCSIHPWMKGLVVVKDHPYVGISDKDGKLAIKNVPTGKWTFQFWQEKSGYLSDVKRGGKSVPWVRGRVELEIKPGANDLGEIKVPLSLFEKKN